MPAGDADRIRRHLCGLVDEARLAGKSMLIIRAGDVHREIGLERAHPNVCQVLRGEKFHTLANVELAGYVHCPPSGQGANLTIEFHLLSGSERSGERSE